MATTLKIIYWNVWFFAQDGTRDDGTRLRQRFNELIRQYKPDIFGLNEVLVNRQDSSSPIIDYLTANGYQCHFAAISPIDKKWAIGNLLASKIKPLTLKEHVLGPDTQAARRGYHGESVKLIEATYTFGQEEVTIIVNYLSNLLPTEWGTHIKHRKSYDRIVNAITNDNLIIGGDFNEMRFRPPRFTIPRHLRLKTGTFRNPTWRLNGKKSQLFFANYDKLIYSEAGNLRLKRFEVLERLPSDHAPLLGIFSVLPGNIKSPR